jgi:very-short-patch-repair endonuclease
MASLLALLAQHWVLIGVAVGIAALFFLARNSGNEVLPAFERRGPLVTGAELKFYRALTGAAGGSWSVFTMVRLADLIKVRAGISSARAWRNRTFGKHVDFIICDNDSLEVRLAIELDDASHNRPHRQTRDAFVNEALSTAGLPLLRIKVADNYDKIELRKQLDQLLVKK